MMTALCPTCLQNAAPVVGGHALTEPVYALTTALARLISTLYHWEPLHKPHHAVRCLSIKNARLALRRRSFVVYRIVKSRVKDQREVSVAKLLISEYSPPPINAFHAGGHNGNESVPDYDATFSLLEYSCATYFS